MYATICMLQLLIINSACVDYNYHSQIISYSIQYIHIIASYNQSVSYSAYITKKKKKSYDNIVIQLITHVVD